MDLLVHISAPTTRKDDDRYRAEALAYCHFEPAVEFRLEANLKQVDLPTIVPRVRTADTEEHGEQALSVKTRKGTNDEIKHASLLSKISLASHDVATNDAASLTPLQKLEAVQMHWRSRETSSNKRPLPTRRDELSATQLMFDTQFAADALESQIYSDFSASTCSGPGSLNSPLREVNSRRRHLSPKVHSPSPPTPPVHAFVNRTGSCGVRDQENRVAHHTTDHVNSLSSQLPSTYGLSKSSGSSSIETPTRTGDANGFLNVGLGTPDERHDNGRSRVDPLNSDPKSTPSRPSISPSSRKNSGRIQSSPIHINRVVIDASFFNSREGQLGNAEITPVSTELNPNPPFKSPIVQLSFPCLAKRQTSLAKTQEAICPTLLAELRTLPLEIFPPDPPVRTTPAETSAGVITFITPHFRAMETYRPLVNIYRVATQTRDIAQFERGHWRVYTNRWPLGAQITFWKEMQRFLHSGNSGNATWCCRESDDENSLGLVKIFCWGEIVMYVYFLIYVTAGKRLKISATEWVDGEGEVIVTVPGDVPAYEDA